MGERINRSYRLDAGAVAMLAEIAEREGISSTAALEASIAAYHAGMGDKAPATPREEKAGPAPAQDADAGEIALLREQIAMLRGLLEAEQRNLEVAQGNVAAMADALKATQAVAALDKGAAPGTALEVAQGAPRLTFRQWLAQRWGR